MIQRIQTIYLFVAFAALIAIYFFPLADFTSEFVYYKLYLTNVKNLGAENTIDFNERIVLPVAIFNGLLALTAAISIFLYKNRRYQSKIVKLGILMNVILVALIFFVFVPLVSRSLNATADYSQYIGIYFTLISLLMLILANRSIIKDEKLVRAADRLR